MVFPDYEPSWKHKLVRSPPTGGMIVFSLVVERPDGTSEQRRMPARRLPRAARRDEHEAARAQAPRVHVGRPAALRGRSARRTCSSTTRASSSRAATASPTSSRSPASTRARSTRSPASSGCRRAIASRAPTTETFSLPQTPGGVLLRPSVRADGPAGLGPRRTGSRPPSSPPRVELTADEVEAAYGEIERRRDATAYLHAPRDPARPARADDVRHRRHRAARGRARRSTSRPCCGWRGRSATAGPTASGCCSATAPASSRRAWRSSTSRTAGSRSQADRDGGVLVYNGEVYNHPELRAELEAAASRSTPRSDTEVVLRLLERDGLAALDRLNGQFAFAWWQPSPRRLTLVRDRFGVRPLHYALLDDGTLVFGSEAKALFASGEVAAEPDLGGHRRRLHPLGRRARRARAFAGVQPARAGRAARLGGRRDRRRAALVDARTTVRASHRRGRPRGAAARQRRGCACAPTSRSAPTSRAGSTRASSPRSPRQESEQRAAHVLGRLQRPALRRARPPGGGRRGARHRSPRRRRRPGEIAGAFPDVVRHAETPLIRTAPVPLYLLARAGARAGHHRRRDRRGRRRAVLGLRPVQGGRAARARRRPTPSGAVELLDRALPVPRPRRRRGAGPPGGASCSRPAPTTTRSARTRPGSRRRRRSRRSTAAEVAAADRRRRLARAPARRSCPPAFAGWSPLERAACLEVTTLLEPYLLAAQGDRVAMAHGVEGRYPFLDHRVFDHAVARCRRAQARRRCTTRSRCASSPSGCCRRRSPGAASSPTAPRRSTPFFARGRPGLGRRALSPGGARRDRDLRPAAGRGPGAALPRRPGDRACARAWPSSGSSRPRSGIERSRRRRSPTTGPRAPSRG